MDNSEKSQPGIYNTSIAYSSCALQDEDVQRKWQ